MAEWVAELSRDDDDDAATTSAPDADDDEDEADAGDSGIESRRWSRVAGDKSRWEPAAAPAPCAL